MPNSTTIPSTHVYIPDGINTGSPNVTPTTDWVTDWAAGPWTVVAQPDAAQWTHYDVVIYYARDREQGDVSMYACLVSGPVEGTRPRDEEVKRCFEQNLLAAYPRAMLLGWELDIESRSARVYGRWGHSMVLFPKNRGAYLYLKGRGMIHSKHDTLKAVDTMYVVNHPAALGDDGRLTLFATRAAAEHFVATKTDGSYDLIQPLKVYDILEY